MRKIRKAAAAGILATAYGLAIEASDRDGKLWRAPFTGAVVFAAAAAVAWAGRELAA